MKVKVYDQRTDDESERTVGYVAMRDRMLSGWGHAKDGVSVYAVAVLDDHDDDDVAAIMEYAEGRLDTEGVSRVDGDDVGAVCEFAGHSGHVTISGPASAPGFYRSLPSKERAS